MQRLHRKRFTAGIALAVVALLAAACSSSSSSSGGSSGSSLSGTLNASGSTLQLPYQQAAISAFKSVQPSMTVNYGGGGSGKGRSDLAAGVVQFAGSDSPIPSDEMANFKGKTVLYFPLLLSPITVSYNLSGVSSGLKLTPTVIAEIFQGKITKWNDSAITSLNPGVKLPSTPISLAVRSDSSGTTANFSLFLMTAEPSVWKLGASSTITWPSSAHAGNGNGGVAQIIKSTPGAIGYVRLRGRQGLRSDLRFGQEQFRQLRRTLDVGGVRGWDHDDRRAGPHVPRRLVVRPAGIPDHRPVVGPGVPEAVQFEHHEDAQGIHGLPGR